MSIGDLIRASVKCPAQILQLVERPGGPPGNYWRASTGRDIAEAILSRFTPATVSERERVDAASPRDMAAIPSGDEGGGE